MKQANNTTSKTASWLTVALLLAIVVTVWSGSSRASDNIEVIERILKHKINTEKLGAGVAVALIENGQTSFINLGLANKTAKQQVSSSTLF